jgi:hypothetical protein
MPETLHSVMITDVVGLCKQVFPDGQYSDHDVRIRGWRYQDQIVGPLSTIQGVESSPLADIMHRVGVFLSKDGKYRQAEELLEKCYHIRSSVEGMDHPHSLRALTDLSLTRRHQ